MRPAAKAPGSAYLGLGTSGPNPRLDAFRQGLHATCVDALKIIRSTLFESAWGRIAELALRYRLPSITEFPEFARAGRLLSYGLSRTAIYRSAAPYVDKILRGARPGDLPMERPKVFDFLINLKTAQALGLTIPQTVLTQATEIIQ